jgi:2-iminobutanoate/2-iminopropanoate deaminase
MRHLRLALFTVLFALAVPAAAQQTVEKTVVGTMQANAMLAPGLMVGNTLYLSGQLPPRATRDSSVTVQTKGTLGVIRDLLQQAKLDLSDVVAVTVYLADINDFNAMNAGYTEMFTASPRPTRTTVAVAGLVGGAKLEITVTAVKTK